MTDARLGASTRAAEARRLAAIVGRDLRSNACAVALRHLTEMAAYEGATRTTRVRTTGQLLVTYERAAGVRTTGQLLVTYERGSAPVPSGLRAVYELGLADATPALTAAERDVYATTCERLAERAEAEKLRATDLENELAILRARAGVGP